MFLMIIKSSVLPGDECAPIHILFMFLFIAQVDGNLSFWWLLSGFLFKYSLSGKLSLLEYFGGFYQVF